ENLRKVKDWLPKARELLTVKRDVPLPVALDQLTDAKRDPARQRAQYERFGFKTWLKEVENAPAGEMAPPTPPAAPVKQRGLRTLLTEDEARELALRLEAAPLAGFGCLASDEEPMTARLVGLSFAFGDEALYLPLAHQYAAAPAQVPLDTALALLKPWLERADCRKVTEDAKLDSHVLANHGIRLAGCVHDTIIESYVLEVHERHELAALAQRHCGWTTLTYDEVTGKGASRIPFSAVDIARATEYAAQQADCILALHEM